jgi:hypothetical protein
MTVSADLITTTYPPDFSLDRVVLTLSLLGHARPPIRSPRTSVSQSLHASIRKPGSHSARSLLSPRTPLTLTAGMSTSNRRSRRSGPSCSRMVSSPKTGRPPSRASATIGTTTPLCSGSSELESLISQHQRPCGRRTRSGERSSARTRLPRESTYELVGDHTDNVFLHLSPHLNALSRSNPYLPAATASTTPSSGRWTSTTPSSTTGPTGKADRSTLSSWANST